jgi:anti-sigma factor ChrR (cupin superfamily)
MIGVMSTTAQIHVAAMTAHEVPTFPSETLRAASASGQLANGERPKPESTVILGQCPLHVRQEERTEAMSGRQLAKGSDSGSATHAHTPLDRPVADTDQLEAARQAMSPPDARLAC